MLRRVQGLAVAGLVLLVIGEIWLVVNAFQTGILWGLGVLLVPCVSLVFLVLHFGRAWKPFLLVIVGAALLGAGGGVNGVQAPTS